MNYSPKFKNVALSALLMSAIAAPVVANADSNLPTTQTDVVTKVEQGTMASLSSVSFVNPLELAKKYAPDTVSEWEKTLEQYQKVTGTSISNYPFSETVTFTAKDQNEAASQFDNLSGSITAVAAVAAVPATSVDKDNFAIKFEKSELAAPTVDNGEPLPAAGIVEFVETVPVPDEYLSFFKAEIGLAEAAASKDAGAIKESLAELLKQYKLQITTLETISKDTAKAAPVKTEIVKVQGESRELNRTE